MKKLFAEYSFIQDEVFIKKQVVNNSRFHFEVELFMQNSVEREDVTITTLKKCRFIDLVEKVINPIINETADSLPGANIYGFKCYAEM